MFGNLQIKYAGLHEMQVWRGSAIMSMVCVIYLFFHHLIIEPSLSNVSGCKQQCLLLLCSFLDFLKTSFLERRERLLRFRKLMKLTRFRKYIKLPDPSKFKKFYVSQGTSLWFMRSINCWSTKIWSAKLRASHTSELLSYNAGEGEKEGTRSVLEVLRAEHRLSDMHTCLTFITEAASTTPFSTLVLYSWFFPASVLFLRVFLSVFFSSLSRRYNLS